MFFARRHISHLFIFQIKFFQVLLRALRASRPWTVRVSELALDWPHLGGHGPGGTGKKTQEPG